MQKKSKEILNKLKKTNGFTMAEMLLTLGILAILLGLAIVGVTKYQTILKGIEMDNHAKQLFLAAQNHLTEAQVTGELGRYRYACSLEETEGELNGAGKGIGLSIGDGSKPSDFPSDGAWAEGEYYYITYSPSERITAFEKSILKYMLPFGATDETLRTGGKYVIEYNPRTAAVYGVFYTEAQNTLTYEDVIILNRSGARGDSREAKLIRRNYGKGVIGYYGGAVTTREHGTRLKDLSITVENGELLQVVITDPNYFRKNSEGVQYATQIKVKIYGIFSGNERNLNLELTGTKQNPLKPENAENWWTGVEKIDNDGEDALQYTLTLDDITTEGMHFSDLFEEKKSTDLIPGEDLEISVEYTDSDGLGIVSDSVKSARTNSLFGDATALDYDNSSGKEHTVHAEIAAFRHLENMEQQISNLRKNPTLVGQVLVTKALQTKSLDWKSFYAPDGETPKTVTWCKWRQGSAPDPNPGTFFGIMNSRLVSYEGNGNTISNLMINNEASASLTDGTPNGGLFRMVSSTNGSKDFTIENLKIAGWNVTSNGTCSLLVAQFADTIANATLQNITVTDSKVISNAGSAGGLCGIAGNKGNLIIQNSSDERINGLTVSASDSAGGLLGHAKCTGDVSVNGIQIENGNAAGENNASMGIAIVESTAAGLTMNSIDIASCKVTSSGDTAGGICGTAYSKGDATISEVTATNLEVHGSFTAAGILGQTLSTSMNTITIDGINMNSITAISDYTPDQINQNETINAGGVVGYLRCKKEVNIRNVIVREPVIRSTKNSAGVLSEIESGNKSLVMENILVTGGNDSLIESNKLSQGNAAGLAAYIGRSATINNCAASVLVIATGERSKNADTNQYFAADAGGLVGELGASGNTIKNCYTGGKTRDGKYALGLQDANLSSANIYGVESAGGLVGKISGTTNIENSYSTCSVAVRDLSEDSGAVSSAGGLVGAHNPKASCKVTYLNCYATGLIRGESRGNVKIGSLTGSANNKSTWSGCYYLTDPWKTWNEAQGSENPEDIGYLKPVGDREITDSAMISEKSYDEMPTSDGVIKAYNYDWPALKGLNYPFTTVNTIGETDPLITGVHFGDWPVMWQLPQTS